MARHAGSASSASNASAIARISPRSKKWCGGRRIATVATWSASSMPSSVVEGRLDMEALSTRGGILPLYDQRVHCRSAVAGRMHDHGIEVELCDALAVVGGELRER